MPAQWPTYFMWELSKNKKTAEQSGSFLTHIWGASKWNVVFSLWEHLCRKKTCFHYERSIFVERTLGFEAELCLFFHTVSQSSFIIFVQLLHFFCSKKHTHLFSAFIFFAANHQSVSAFFCEPTCVCRAIFHKIALSFLSCSPENRLPVKWTHVFQQRITWLQLSIVALSLPEVLLAAVRREDVMETDAQLETKAEERPRTENLRKRLEKRQKWNKRKA